MKKTLLTLALVATTVASFAQGKVGFANDSTRVFTMGNAGQIAGADAAFAGQGIPTAGLPSGGLSALLYAGTSAGSLTLQTAIPLTGTSIPTAGRMSTKNVILTGIPAGAGQSFQIIIASTSATAVPTIVGGAGANAFADTLYFGTSGLFTFTSGGSVTYPLIYAAPSTWASGPVVITAVPEPSSMALAGIGAASLLIFRRRK